MDTFEGNKIICEYMGYTVENTYGDFWARYKDGKYHGEFEHNGNYYHKNWSFLMDVIKKIQNESLINENMFHGLNDIYDALLTLDIIQTWKAVVDTLNNS